ncbi:hypothetical protein BC832DRAFT_559988 [Gaertneriomyces semiglobifer]|nr:hypothetical protein BC832DRAFT_559988 [Gaertneriomyces semiglobifer]
MPLSDQEQSAPVSSNELADMLLTMNLTATVPPPSQVERQRRPAKRQSSGPLTPASVEDIPPDTRAWESGIASVSRPTPAERAAVLFGMNTSASSSTPVSPLRSPRRHSTPSPRASPTRFPHPARGHWTSRVMVTSPTRMRQLRRNTTDTHRASSSPCQSSQRPPQCPSTPDPRRIFVRHHTAPTSPFSSPTKSKRCWVIPPASSSSASTSPFQNKQSSLTPLPRAPGKKRKTVMFLVNDGEAGSLLRRHSIGDIAEEARKRRRPDIDERWVDTTQLGVWDDLFNNREVIGEGPSSSCWVPLESAEEASHMRLDELEGLDRLIHSPARPATQTPPDSEPPSPCKQQADRMELAKSMEQLVHITEAQLKLE